MTYSIVARDPETGELGVAVQSHYFSVGPIVPWVEAGVGAVATQASIDVSYGPRGLDLMRGGKTASEALAALVAKDELSSRRQVGMVDAAGNVATHTGDKCIAYAGHRSGPGVTVQANMMERDTVPDAMLAAYESTSGSLATRMLAALDAAEAEGGDIRGKQSAAMVISEGKKHGETWQGRLLDLRVEDHPEPLIELRRLAQLHEAYRLFSAAEEAGNRGDAEEAAKLGMQGMQLAQGNAEMDFWAALSMATGGMMPMAKEFMARAVAVEPRLKELARRMPATGQLLVTDETIRELLED
ncbi:MAG: DUF1028 domain-containing protein [Chloroflexota bacterium]